MATPLPPVPNTIKAQLIFVFGDNASVECIQHFLLPAGSFPLSAANVTSLANSVMSNWATNMAPVMTTAISLANVNVTDLNTATGIEGANTHAAVPGTVGTAPVMAGTAGVVSFGTNFRGRSFRGREYLAGLPQADTLTPQLWAPAFATAVSAAFLAYIVGMSSIAAPGPAQFCIVSYFSGKIPNPNPLSRNRFVPQRRVTPLSTVVQQVTMKQRVGSQRRRNN